MVCLVCSWQSGIEESTRGPRRSKPQMQTHFTDNLDRETQYAEMGWWHREFILYFLHLACVSFDCCYAQAFLCICLFFLQLDATLCHQKHLSLCTGALLKNPNPAQDGKAGNKNSYFGITKALEEIIFLSHVILVTQKMHISPSNVTLSKAPTVIANVTSSVGENFRADYQ